MIDSVSIVIPTWNRADSIEKAITSALDQTHAPLEILVCDDGSTDRTEEIVRAIDDPRVKWLPGPRGGCPAIPRNRGINASRGEWLAFLDSDDSWLPNKLAEQFLALKNGSCQAACSNAFRNVPPEGIVGTLIEWNKPRITFITLLHDNKVITSSVLVRRSLLELSEGFPEDHALKVGEDYSLWLRVATQTDFAYVNAALVEYRDDPVNSVRAESVAEDLQRSRVLHNFRQWIFTKRPAVAPFYLCLIIWNAMARKYRLLLQKLKRAARYLKNCFVIKGDGT